MSGLVDWSNLDGSALNTALPLGSSAAAYHPQHHQPQMPIGYQQISMGFSPPLQQQQQFHPQAQQMQYQQQQYQQQPQYQQYQPQPMMSQQHHQAQQMIYQQAQQQQAQMQQQAQQQQGPGDFSSQIELIRNLEREKLELEADIRRKKAQHQVRIQPQMGLQQPPLGFQIPNLQSLPPDHWGAGGALKLPQADFRTQHRPLEQPLSKPGLSARLVNPSAKVPPLRMSELTEKSQQTQATEQQIVLHGSPDVQKSPTLTVNGEPLAINLHEPEQVGFSALELPSQIDPVAGPGQRQLKVGFNMSQRKKDRAILNSVCPYLEEDLSHPHVAEGKQLFLDLRVEKLEKGVHQAEIKRYQEKNDRLQDAREQCKRQIAEIYKKMAEIDGNREENDKIIEKHKLELEASNRRAEDYTKRMERLKREEAEEREQKRLDEKIAKRVEKYASMVATRPSIMNSTLDRLVRKKMVRERSSDSRGSGSRKAGSRNRSRRTGGGTATDSGSSGPKLSANDSDKQTSSSQGKNEASGSGHDPHGPVIQERVGKQATEKSQSRSPDRARDDLDDLLDVQQSVQAERRVREHMNSELHGSGSKRKSRSPDTSAKRGKSREERLIDLQVQEMMEKRDHEYLEWGDGGPVPGFAKPRHERGSQRTSVSESIERAAAASRRASSRSPHIDKSAPVTTSLSPKRNLTVDTDLRSLRDPNPTTDSDPLVPDPGDLKGVKPSQDWKPGK